jgi:hypothetical protein
VRLPPLALCLGIGLWGGLHADRASGAPLWQEEEQRLRVGIKIFSAVLGAVEGISDRAAPDGTIEVVVVHKGSADAASQAALDLEAMGQIQGRPLRLRTLTAKALDNYTEPAPLGVFVASTRVPTERLRAWSERLRTLVFSPFAGDVEAGAVAGLHITDQILPYVNTAQAGRAGVRFRAFFLKVARQHD